MSNIFDRIANSFFNSSPQGSLILVAGKDANNHRNYESIITGAGYHYSGKYSLGRGYSLSFWENPDLIIWDLNVNETASDSILFCIETHYDLPVLIFTDDNSAMSADRAISSFPKGYRNAVRIRKPVTTEQLLTLISQYLYEQTAPLIKDTIDESL